MSDNRVIEILKQYLDNSEIDNISDPSDRLLFTYDCVKKKLVVCDVRSLLSEYIDRLEKIVSETNNNT